MLHDDVIIQATIVKGEINLHNLLVWSEIRSVDTARCMSSKSPAMAYDLQNFLQEFPGKHLNASRIRSCHSGRSRAHLAVSTK